MVRPVWANTFWLAGLGPIPIMRGATPAKAIPSTRARGVKPFFSACSLEAKITAQAPSLTPEALPAVMVPSGRTIGRSEEHTSELQSRGHLVCRLLLEKKKNERKHLRQ